MATGNYYEEHKGSPPIYNPYREPYHAPYPSAPGSAAGNGSAKPSGKTKTRKKRSAFRRILRVILLVILTLGITGGIAGGIMTAVIISQAPSLDAMMVSPSQSATYICDSDGNRQQKLTLPEANRDLVTIDHIPVSLQHAFVSIEDSRFYSHNGIDLPGIARAIWIGLTTRNFSEGASTITQQLLKNSVFTGWTSETSFLQRLKRKIQEQYLAIQLEKLLTKDQILEDYLNTINLGAGCYGVQSAAYRYFGKDVSELSLSEATVIAGITQNPTRYNPIVNPDNNARRRQIVLQYMYDQKYISREEMDEALSDNVYERIQSNEDSLDTSASVYTYYQDALIDQVVNDLMNEKSYTYKQAYKAVYAGGLRIWSAQDMEIQKICDEEFANENNFPKQTLYGLDYALSVEGEEGEITHYGNDALISWLRSNSDPDCSLMFSSIKEAQSAPEGFRGSVLSKGVKLLGERITVTPQPQASVVIIDQATGQVKAIVGGRGSKDASLTLNRATYTTRQPGSTFKILTAFGPALNEGGQTLATVYEGGDYFYENGMKVSNWDVNDKNEAVTMREAIVRSVNTAAVMCITQITPRTGYDYARAFGITTLIDNYESNGNILTDIIQPLALGGITRGVTNLELCGAYACIANSGRYIQPRFYTKVTDTKGEIILDHQTPAERTVLKETAAYELTDAMRDVILREDGTAHDEIDLGEMDTAGKTGTTSDYRDIWFAGYTPFYTCCVWGGYDNNQVLPDDGAKGLGHSYSKVLWNSIMKRIHRDLPAKTFKRPYTIQTMDLCSETKQAASPGCPDTYTEVFEIGTAPDTWCEKHGSGGHIEGITPQTDSSMANDAITISITDQAVIPGPDNAISITNQGNQPLLADTAFSQGTQDIPDIVITTSDTAGWNSTPADNSLPDNSLSDNNMGQGGNPVSEDIVIIN